MHAPTARPSTPGWTPAELRKIGFAEAGKKRAPRDSGRAQVVVE